MKLTLILLIFCSFRMGTGYSQTISLNFKNIALEKVLKEVKRQTGYHFIYGKKEITRVGLVDVNIVNATITDALTAILKRHSLNFQVQDKYIIISNAPLNDIPSSPVDKGASTPIVLAPITGQVTNDKGEPLVGMTINIRGTRRGTSTDANGNFKIEASVGDVLQITGIGYLPAEVLVGKDAHIVVKLAQDVAGLGDVVVVGYGKQKKISVTGAIASVSSKQLQQSAVANLSNALAGRLPGLIAVQNSGEPGADAAKIWIRGIATYTGSQSPLVMVDGVERDYNGLDANEVENITILKDASSTAAYGVRGANGVVLVTTKRGSVAAPAISFNVQHGVQTPTRLPEYLDSYDALKLYREGLENDGLNASLYTDDYISKFRDRSSPAYQYLYPNVSWLDSLLKKTSSLTQANLNVSGGTKTAKYFVSVSYLNQQGLYKGDKKIEDYNIQAVTNKYNFRSNVDLSLTKDLDMEVNLGAIIRDRNYPGSTTDQIFLRAKITPAWWYPVTNPNGTLGGIVNRPLNPIGYLTETGYNRSFENTLQATTGFTLRMPWLTEGLSARVRVSFDAMSYRNVTRGKTFYSYNYTIAPETETDLDKGNYVLVSTGTNNLGYDVLANSNRKTVIETYLNYDRDFGVHGLKGMLLYTQQSMLESVGTGQENAVAGLPYKYQGYVGRLEYAYDKRYLLEFNAGFNGSENFARGKRFGFFPAVSAGWVVSNEKFLANNKIINLLKFRGSYGEVGNDKIGGSRFLYQSSWSLTSGYYQFGPGVGGDGYAGAEVSANGNINATWEKAKKANIGLDLGLLNDLVTLNIDVFKERRTDILTEPLLTPDYLGVNPLPNINAGIVENKGYEIVLEHRQNFSDQGYFIRANYSFARNKIIAMEEPAFTGLEWQAQTGRRIGTKYGLIAVGLFHDEAEIVKNPDQSAFGAIKPGDLMYKDLNGDNKITSVDMAYLNGVSTPESILGFAAGYHYKGFDISFLFQGAFGGSVWYTGSAVFPFSKWANVLADVKDNYWTAGKDNSNATYPRMTSNENPNNYQNSTFWLRSSNYVRLKNLELGYVLPTSWLHKVKFSSARIYVNGLNLLTWDKIKIFDPEMPDMTGDYPQMKVFNAGINFSF